MEEIALALACCLALAFVSKRWSLPAIPFYILAGVVLGKSGLGLVPADEYTQYLSYLGLIFLLFYVGLEIRQRACSARESPSSSPVHRPERELLPGLPLCPGAGLPAPGFPCHRGSPLCLLLCHRRRLPR